jgi:hypothetical protein
VAETGWTLVYWQQSSGLVRVYWFDGNGRRVEMAEYSGIELVEFTAPILRGRGLVPGIELYSIPGRAGVEIKGSRMRVGVEAASDAAAETGEK